jgi:hypothetical protein
MNVIDNHMFVASTLIGFTVMERYPAIKVVVAHGKASWMQEVLEKMEASGTEGSSPCLSRAAELQDTVAGV